MHFRLALQIAAPLAVLGIGAFTTTLLWQNKPEAEPDRKERSLQQVRVMTAETIDHPTMIRSQGNIVARSRVAIVPEVRGKIVELSTNLVKGGSIRKGEVLVQIERSDYELAIVRSQADVQRTRLRLAQERAEADVARREWAELGIEAEPDPLVTREPQLAQAEAEAAAARAALQQAELNLTRTELRAPFDGRVLDESVDVGQVILAGTQIATIYSTDAFEVELQVDDTQARFLATDLHKLDRQGTPHPQARFFAAADLSGPSWQGQVLRTAGAIDQRTRLITLIAEIAQGDIPDRLELSVPTTFDSAEAAQRALGQTIGAWLPFGAAHLAEEFRAGSYRATIELTLPQNRADLESTRRSLLSLQLPEGFGSMTVETVRGTSAPPPQLGKFVHALIEGRTLSNVIRVPRAALRGGSRVLLVGKNADGNDVLRIRDIVIARNEQTVVYASSGLQAGDRVVTSRITTFVDGMRVQVVADTASGSTGDE